MKNINYELALELKNNGYPQGSLPFYCDECKKDQYNDEGIDHCSCFLNPQTKEPKEVFPTQTYIPTLSELITACGTGFSSLSVTAPDRASFRTRYIAKGYIGGTSFGGQRQSIDGGIAQTPEEAVARLWLALIK